MGKYKKALKEIADIIWESDADADADVELERIAEVIDRTDRTLWEGP